MPPVYRALAAFEMNGWVDVSVEERDNAPDAKVYALTPAGREELVAWAEGPYVPAERPMAPDFSARMNFAGRLGPRQALRIVRIELEHRRRQREEEQHPVLPTEDVDPIPEIDRDWLQRIDVLTHDRGWQSTSLFIGWLETTERELERECRRQGIDPDAALSPTTDPATGSSPLKARSGPFPSRPRPPRAPIPAPAAPTATPPSSRSSRPSARSSTASRAWCSTEH